MNFKHIKKVFDDYVKTFNLTEYPIYYKWKHSYRVMKNSVKIAKSLNLSKRDIELAKVIGLLHDIGRFEQWQKYHTFSDSKSEDHSDIGVRILFEDNFIEKFNIEPEYHKAIKLAIKWHNDKVIGLDDFYLEDGTIDQNCLLHAQIIRDADKLDIFLGQVKRFAPRTSLDLPKEEVNPVILEEFNKFGNATTKNVKSTVDRAIFLLAMAFDFNYKLSYIRTLKMNYHKCIYRNYSPYINDENKAILKECVQKFENHVKNKIKTL